MNRSLMLSLLVLIVIILAVILGFYYGQILQPVSGSILSLVKSSIFLGLIFLALGLRCSYGWLRGYGVKLGSLGFWDVNTGKIFSIIPPNKSSLTQRNLLLGVSALFFALSGFSLTKLI